MEGNGRDLEGFLFFAKFQVKHQGGAVVNRRSALDHGELAERCVCVETRLHTHHLTSGEGTELPY